MAGTLEREVREVLKLISLTTSPFVPRRLYDYTITAFRAAANCPYNPNTMALSGCIHSNQGRARCSSEGSATRICVLPTPSTWYTPCFVFTTSIHRSDMSSEPPGLTTNQRARRWRTTNQKKGSWSRDSLCGYKKLVNK